MPDQSSNRATIRKPYSAQIFCSIIGSESTVLTGSISSATNTDITYTTSTGSSANVAEDMEVEIFRGGISKGRLRVAIGGTISSTNLPVNEHENARINIIAGDTLSVYREWRLHDRIVAANATFDKDSRLTYSNQNSTQPPYMNCGAPRVGFASGGTKTFTHSAAGSISVTGGGFSYSWDVRSQTVSGGSVSSASVTVDYAPGLYWISCTGTTSGVSSTKYVPVRVHDANDMPLRVLDVQVSGSRGAGWSASFSVQEPASLSDVPDGTMIILWSVDTYDGTEQSFGAPQSGASNILFVGWLNQDTSNTTFSERGLQFNAIGVVQRLQQLPGFSQVLQRESSPTNWQGYAGLNTTEGMIYILRWHTTLQRLCDLYTPTRNYDYPAFFIEAGTPLEQTNTIADAVDAQISDSRIGELIIDDDLNLAASATRSGAVTTMTLQPRDVNSYALERDHTYDTNTVEGRGLSSGASQSESLAFFSRAPGVPSEAPGQTVVDGLILASSGAQTDLNDRTGWRFAKENRLKDGLPAPRVTFELRGAYRVFDFYSEWLAIAIGDSYTYREIDNSSARGVIESISMSYRDGGGGSINITVQFETDGEAGVTYIPPAPEDNGFPPLESLDFSIPDFNLALNPVTPLDTYWITGTNSTIARFERGDLFYVTTNAHDAEPEWTAISWSSLGGGFMTALDFAVDATDPDAAWILTTTGIRKLSDIFGTPTLSAEQITFGVTATDGTIHANLGSNTNFVVATFYNAVARTTYETHTTDGSTWSTEQAVVSVTGSANLDTPGVQVSRNNANTVYISAAATDPGVFGVPLGWNIYSSTNGGASYSVLLSDAGIDRISAVHLAFGDTADDLWYGIGDNNTSPYLTTNRTGLYRTDTGTGTNYLDGFNDGTYKYGVYFSRGITSNPLNSDVVLVAAQTAGASFFNYRTFITNDRGETWVETPNPTNEKFIRVVIGGNGEYAYAFTSDLKIFVAQVQQLLAGVGWQRDASGNISGGLKVAIGIMGGGRA